MSNFIYYKQYNQFETKFKEKQLDIIVSNHLQNTSMVNMHGLI